MEEKFTNTERHFIDLLHDTINRMGIWIMPNCKGKGALESFLYNKIKKPNTLLAKVENAIKSLEDDAKKDSWLQAKIYKPSHKKKAVVHTYMSWKEPPDVSFGTALKAHFFTQNTEEEVALVEWLKNMYQ